MRKIGIEIENESLAVSVHDAMSYLSNSQSWVVEQDGSLRGGAHGWEIKTAGSGLALPRALASLNELYPVMSDSSGVWRAAVHVHVDASDLTWQERAVVLCMAYIFDRSVFNTVSPERVESNFCVPLDQKSAAVFSTVAQMLSGNAERIGYGKYSSVNSDSLMRFGTFEFRHMRTPRCDSTIPSVRAALDAIANFATIAHGIVDSCRYVQGYGTARDSRRTPRERLVQSVLALVHMAESAGSLFPAGVQPDPIAVLNLLSFLQHSPADMADVDYGSLFACATQSERRVALMRTPVRRRIRREALLNEARRLIMDENGEVQVVEFEEYDPEWEEDHDYFDEEEDV